MRLLFCILLLVPPLAQAQERVVSLGGAVTEVVYALGAGDRLVATDGTSNHPPPAAALPKLGYFRQLTAEPILALGPDMVLAIAGSGPATTLEQVAAAGGTVVSVPNEPTPEGIARKIEVIGQALGRGAESERLAADVLRDLTAVEERVAALDERPAVLFLLSAGQGSPTGGGAGTGADAIIRMAGGRNALESVQGYKPLNAEALLRARPEVILMMSEGLEAAGGRDGLLGRPAIAATPAAQNGRIVDMEAMLLLGFGPRTPEAVRRLAAALHPQAEDGAPQ